MLPSTFMSICKVLLSITESIGARMAPRHHGLCNLHEGAKSFSTFFSSAIRFLKSIWASIFFNLNVAMTVNAIVRNRDFPFITTAGSGFLCHPDCACILVYTGPDFI